MKPVNEVLAMSELELIQDHARLDIKLEIRNHEAAQLRHGLYALVKELGDAKRHADALRVLKILEITGKSVSALIEAMETERLERLLK